MTSKSAASRAPDSDRSLPPQLCRLQEGFLAQDDAGAHEAYERELDEEEGIKRLDAQAAALRAEGAAHAASNGSIAAASHAAAAGGSAGKSTSLMCHLPCNKIIFISHMFTYSKARAVCFCHCCSDVGM